LVLSIILLRIETGTELFVALLLAWIAVMMASNVAKRHGVLTTEMLTQVWVQDVRRGC